MAKNLKLPLPAADSLFSTQEERDGQKREKVYDIPLSEIDPFPDHPFRVIVDDEMQVMVESIKAVGVQTPATIRKKANGRYEMVSGHRRQLGSELAGLDTLPCIIREMNTDEAVIAMVDSNLQRETILPSEKAKSYKMRYEAMKRQAGRPRKDNVSPVGTNFRSDEELAEMTGDSRNQIHRYIRLNELIPPLLNLVDGGEIPMRPAVEISYLSQEQQNVLHDVIGYEERTPSHTQAAEMRKLSGDGKLTDAAIHSIMREEQVNQPKHFKIPRERISRFFPETVSPQTIEDTIIKALELWYKKKR